MKHLIRTIGHPGFPRAVQDWNVITESVLRILQVEPNSEAHEYFRNLSSLYYLGMEFKSLLYAPWYSKERRTYFKDNGFAGMNSLRYTRHAFETSPEYQMLVHCMPEMW